MSIFSAVFSRSAGGWWGAEAEVAQAGGIDDIADLMRDVVAAHDPDAAEGTMVLMLEADDEWFAVVRVDDHGDPRVFLSDVRVVHEHPVAEILLDTGTIQAPEQAEGTGQKPYPVPGGDDSLLADLGIPATELVELTLSEGLLPGDVLDELSERAGFAERLDALRL
ncbi:tRNA adenosine deaminase-associated protein [Nocardiopsis sediminis]|uniref:tRNA adenosine deaminase-associated protein n=1 Tax=Nocardiopsis sediminis TaxID=1778267 RepID=A0ABV8FT48_9ACTN